MYACTLCIYVLYVCTLCMYAMYVLYVCVGGGTYARAADAFIPRYLRQKGIPPHSIGIADGGVQGVDDAPGPFSLACSPLCRKSCLTWESRHRCILSAPCPNPNRITNILHKHGARRAPAWRIKTQDISKSIAYGQILEHQHQLDHDFA